jgi:predicted enzyme related to lactoylglutathione lyase
MLLLSADDVAALTDFYHDGLGLSVTAVDGERFALLDAGGVRLAICDPQDWVAGSAATAAFRVDDITAAVVRLCAEGAVEVQPIEAGPHEQRAVLRDPSGHLFVVYEPG